MAYLENTDSSALSNKFPTTKISYAYDVNLTVDTNASGGLSGGYPGFEFVGQIGGTYRYRRTISSTGTFSVY